MSQPKLNHMMTIYSTKQLIGVDLCTVKAAQLINPLSSPLMGDPSGQVEDRCAQVLQFQLMHCLCHHCGKNYDLTGDSTGETLYYDLTCDSTGKTMCIGYPMHGNKYEVSCMNIHNNRIPNPNWPELFASP